MKLKKSRDLIIFLILIPVFLLGAFYISSRREGGMPTYSVINKSSTGCSVFYETLKSLSIPVERTIKPVDKQDTNSVQIVAAGGSLDINSDEIKRWIKDGGALVHLSSGNLHLIDYGLPPEVKGRYSLYRFGKGLVITTDINSITNKAIMADSNEAYELLREVSSYQKKKIYFNEEHLFSAASNKNLWDYIPMWGKFLVYQFVLILVAFFYLKGKRFGKPVTLYEEVERTENEYLYSASALYRQAKCYDLILENYYNKLLKDLNSNHENWLEIWQREKLPLQNQARKVYDFMGSKNRKKKQKEYLQIASIIEKLNSTLMKRRDSYWKTLKKTQ